MAYTIFDWTYDNTDGDAATKERAAWDAYWGANQNTRDNEFTIGDAAYNNVFNRNNGNEELAWNAYNSVPEEQKNKSWLDNSWQAKAMFGDEENNSTMGIPGLNDDNSTNGIRKKRQQADNKFSESDYNPTVENSMQKYWDTANTQAVQNYAKAGKFGDDIGNVFKDNGDVNWGWLEENNFWKNADGSKKSLKQIYGDNGVTYEGVLDAIGNLADRANINNERALSAMGPNRNGQAQDFYTRDTRNGENFTNADKQIMSAQLQGREYLKDVNPALYSQLESQMVDTSGGRQLKGQDLADMEYGYDATEGTYGNEDTSLNGLNADQVADYLSNNQTDLSQAVANNQLAEIFANTGSDLNSLKTVTDKMTNAGLSLKNPNGRTDDDFYMGDNKDKAQTYTSMKKWMDKYKQKGADTQQLDTQLDYNKDLDAAQLNAAIIASAAAAGNNAIRQPYGNVATGVNQELINQILSMKDKYGANFIEGGAPQYEYGQPDDNSVFNLENLGKKAASSSNSHKYDESKNYWTESNNLFNDDIENALRRIGLRRK